MPLGNLIKSTSQSLLDSILNFWIEFGQKTIAYTFNLALINCSRLETSHSRSL